MLRGQSAACGLPPACHLTTRRHLALPLAGMTQSGRKHINGTVLPAWQQSCKEGSGVRKCGGGGGGGQAHQQDGVACLEAELQGGIRCGGGVREGGGGSKAAGMGRVIAEVGESMAVRCFISLPLSGPL